MNSSPPHCDEAGLFQVNMHDDPLEQMVHGCEQ
jgi:hypothetical protein